MALLQLLLFALLSISLAVDRMPLGSRLLATESLISTNGTVKLEFFSPPGGNSEDLYLGITFNTRTSEFIPIWIANRDTPVSSNASLLLTSEGELQIIDRGSIIWSGAPSSRNSGITQAVLLDTANFVLTGSSFDPGDDNATYPWQSYDHPADAWVPRMKMFLGANLTAWKSSVSPASGRFIMTMRTSTEFVISTTSDTSRQFWTSGRWNGNIFSLVPQMTENYLYTFTFNATNPPYFTWFEKTFQHSIFRLGHDGRIEVKQLDGNGNWYTPWVVPSNICEVTSLCGPNSTCTSSSSPPCSCPTGSGPTNETNWRTEDWAEGCNSLSSQSRTSSSKNSGVAIGVGVGAGVALLLLAGVAAFVVVRRRTKANRVSSGSGSSKSGGSIYKFVGGELAHFTFKQLHAATDGFKKHLGSGGFGEVFKGSIQGEAVAVKRLMKFDDKQFRAEVSTIGTVQHINLVRLRGFCADGALQRLLVYEFVERGSLDRSLFNRDLDDPVVLSWSQRFGVALGTAKGLAYLHEECRDRIIHCDIKPENILLDAEMKPKVADFGLAKLMGREFSRVVTTMRGTRGYLAPEWLSNMPITPKADVYSYGMTLLEIISGRRNIDVQQNQVFYPLWAAQQVRSGEFSKLPDDRLKEWDEEELRRAAKTAIWCVQDDEINRPSMKTVVQMLEGSATDFPEPVIPSSFEVWLEIKEESG